MTEDELLEEVLARLDQLAPVEKPEPGEFCAQDYASRHRISEKAATHRLKVLTERGILASRLVNHKRYYKINPKL